MMDRLHSMELKLEARQKLSNLKNDMLVLKNIWFHKLRVRLRGSARQFWREAASDMQPECVPQFAGGKSRPQHRLFVCAGCVLCVRCSHASLRGGSRRPLLYCFLPPCCEQDTDDHAERLEGFYKGQAHACECAVPAGSWQPCACLLLRIPGHPPGAQQA
jgi:hypothetical protein